MFEQVNVLARHLPQPVVKTDIHTDFEVVDQYLANAHAMRSEALACLGRSVASAFRRVVDAVFRPFVGMPSHQG